MCLIYCAQRPQKIEHKNTEYQNQHCKAVSEYTEDESILFRNYNSHNKWVIGIIEIGYLHYLIKYNYKVVKIHLDQLRPNHLNSYSSHDPSDIVSEILCDNESLTLYRLNSFFLVFRDIT